MPSPLGELAKQMGDSVFLGPDFLVVDSLEHVKQGMVISLVRREPKGTGGGGLVWVDGETGCAVVLKRYE